MVYFHYILMMVSLIVTLYIPSKSTSMLYLKKKNPACLLGSGGKCLHVYLMGTLRSKHTENGIPTLGLARTTLV